MNPSDGFKGKKILFFSWPFYQYPKKIEKQLEVMGAEVTTFLSAPTDSFLKIRLLEKFAFLKKSYFNEILKKIHNKKYDFVFMINAAIFPKYFLDELYKECENSCKILYSWDSMKIYPAAVNMHKYFDYIFSFDSEDVEKYSYMRFLPLFYCDDLYSGYSVEECKYDLSFVGFGHTERYNFIDKIKKFADKNEYEYCFKLYLPSMLHYIRGKYIKRLFPNAQKKDFVFQSVSMEEMKEITANSKVVIDMELSTQSGLTMRTIETHGMRKKLITTNPKIAEYDFYNPSNILIVDRINPQITKEFVEEPYLELQDELYRKYSLSNWLKEIFMVNKDDKCNSSCL